MLMLSQSQQKAKESLVFIQITCRELIPSLHQKKYISSSKSNCLELGIFLKSKSQIQLTPNLLPPKHLLQVIKEQTACMSVSNE